MQIMSTETNFTPQKGENGLYGFTDGQGIWIIDPTYNHIYPWQELYIVVKTTDGDERWGYFNKKGELLQPLYYGEIKPVWYDNEVLVAWENGEGDYIFPDGGKDAIDDDEAEEEENSMVEWE